MRKTSGFTTSATYVNSISLTLSLLHPKANAHPGNESVYVLHTLGEGVKCKWDMQEKKKFPVPGPTCLIRDTLSTEKLFSFKQLL